MVQASWQHLHVLISVNWKSGSGAVRQFGESGNESGMLQLRVEIRVTLRILETHLLRDEDLKVLTSLRTTTTVCCKWHDYHPYISRHWFPDIFEWEFFAHLSDYYKPLKTVPLSFVIRYIACTSITQWGFCVQLERVARQDTPIQVGV